MSLDVKSRKQRLKEDKININLVPFIDILFTILIFIIVTSSFAGTAMNDNSNGTGTGKPTSDTSGVSEYYIIPVQGLQQVIVDGQDMSSLIKDNSIAIHSKVIDGGEIKVDSKNKIINITTPSDVNTKDAVKTPSNEDMQS